MVSHSVISYCVIMVNAGFCDQFFVILSGSPVSHVSMFFSFLFVSGLYGTIQNLNEIIWSIYHLSSL